MLMSLTPRAAVLSLHRQHQCLSPAPPHSFSLLATFSCCVPLAGWQLVIPTVSKTEAHAPCALCSPPRMGETGPSK